MNIRQLPSGNWQIREMYNGRTYTKTVQRKPSKREAAIIIEELYKKDIPQERGSFEYYARKYIDSKYNVLSPSTVLCYQKLLRWISEDFKHLYLAEIDNYKIQTEVNTYSLNHSPKSTHNLFGFISAVLTTFYPSLNICVTLPQKVKNEPYIPSDEDVNRVLSAAKDSKYELPLYLASLGLRVSEIIALTDDCYVDGTLFIRKAKVLNSDGFYVEKGTKTTNSTRQIVLPEYVCQLIEKHGLRFDFHPNSMAQWLTRLQKQLDIPHFSLHKFRHHFASKMLTLTDAKTVQDLGGWSSDYTMKRVYNHSLLLQNKDKQKELIEKFMNT